MSNEPLTLEGVPELIRKLENPVWAYKPAGAFLDRWRFSTQRKAVANMKRGPGGWIDTGGTRQSLTSERDNSPLPQWAKVGSNKPTARWGEYGTGLLSEDPESPKRRYFPPPSAFDRWAPKHGMTPFMAALSIYKKGGTEPRRFLRDAAEATEQDIPKYLGLMAKEIEMEASRGTS